MSAPMVFPLQTQKGCAPGPLSIPWAMAEVAYGAYAQRHGRDQSLERLAERGGFSWGEMDLLHPGWRAEVAPVAAAEARTLAAEKALAEEKNAAAEHARKLQRQVSEARGALAEERALHDKSEDFWRDKATATEAYVARLREALGRQVLQASAEGSFCVLCRTSSPRDEGKVQHIHAGACVLSPAPPPAPEPDPELRAHYQRAEEEQAAKAKPRAPEHLKANYCGWCGLVPISTDGRCAVCRRELVDLTAAPRLLTREEVERVRSEVWEVSCFFGNAHPGHYLARVLKGTLAVLDTALAGGPR